MARYMVVVLHCPHSWGCRWVVGAVSCLSAVFVASASASACRTSSSLATFGMRDRVLTIAFLVYSFLHVLNIYPVTPGSPGTPGTRDDRLVMCLQWMAPEVLASEKYTETADVYSFAIVCWELLERACPYEGMSQIQVAHDLCLNVEISPCFTTLYVKWHACTSTRVKLHPCCFFCCLLAARVDTYLYSTTNGTRQVYSLLQGSNG